MSIGQSKDKLNGFSFGFAQSMLYSHLSTTLLVADAAWSTNSLPMAEAPDTAETTPRMESGSLRSTLSTFSVGGSPVPRLNTTLTLKHTWMSIALGNLNADLLNLSSSANSSQRLVALIDLGEHVQSGVVGDQPPVDEAASLQEKHMTLLEKIQAWQERILTTCWK